MAGNSWTKEQMNAINARDCSLLIAAGAGAGKTAVLVERIIQKITSETNPVDIDRLLIMTFTRAASTEMRERIAHAITRILDENPGSKVLGRQLALLNKASITTIHSFCMEVIKNNFHKAAIDPNFRIADETEALLIKREAIDDVFDEIYEDSINEDVFINSDFYKLLEGYSGNKDDSVLKDLVLNIYEFVQSHPWPKLWLREHTEDFNIELDADFSSTKWGKIILDRVRIEISSMKEMMSGAVEILKEEESLKGYYERFNNEYNALCAILLANDSNINNTNNDNNTNNLDTNIYNNQSAWDQLYHQFRNFTFEKLPRRPKDSDEELCEYLKKIRDKVKDRFAGILKDVFVNKSEVIMEEIRALYPVVSTLSQLAQKFSDMYQKKKAKRGLLDFSDLEHYCLKVLSKKDGTKILPSEVAMSYKEKYHEILVDEYQDSNLVQEIIIKMIGREDLNTPNVFMVGDVKQSIYRFRQARPELFLEKYNSYSATCEGNFRKILLYANFRSRKEIIDGVNFVFSQVMSSEIGELNYDKSEALLCGANYENIENVSFNCEVHILDLEGGVKKSIAKGEANSEGNAKPSFIEPAEYSEASFEEIETDEISSETSYESEDILDEEMLDSIENEARLVATNILALMENKENPITIFDKNENVMRKLQYRDIVILLRTTSNWSSIFVEQFMACGIPVFSDNDTGFFKTMEVNIIISLLEIIDNPLQDIPLLAVLRSPVYSFDVEELSDIKLVGEFNYLYEALLFMAQSEDKENSKSKRFINDLNKWREKATYLTTDELIWQLYEDTGFMSYVGVMPGGKQRQANLRILFERAGLYEKTSFRGLFNFVNFVNKLKSGKVDINSAKILNENENLVRIISIHKSKGLEFPVVILAGCGKLFNMQDTRKRILLHQDLGFGPDFVDINRRLYHASMPKLALNYCVKSESLSEEMRLLYVAMTRAREKLIITGVVKKLDVSFDKWCNNASTNEDKIPGYKLISSSTFLDYIMPALIRHSTSTIPLEYTNRAFSGTKVVDDSKWDFKIFTKNDLKIGTVKKILSDESGTLQILKDIGSKKSYSQNTEEINRRLNWEYPFIKAFAIPSKVSVTELKKRFSSIDEDDVLAGHSYIPPLVKRPKFLDEKLGLNQAQKGTALHFVMQNLNLLQVSDVSQIKMQIQQMRERELLTEEQLRSVDVQKINNFFSSDIGKRMLASKSVYREIPFNLEIQSKVIFEELADKIYDDEITLLQGVIDCYFVENDKIILLDYKSDFVSSENIDILQERYRLQMKYYDISLKKLTGLEVVEKIIYLFYNGNLLRY